MFCEACGKEITSPGKFCEYCGAELKSANMGYNPFGQIPYSPVIRRKMPGKTKALIGAGAALLFLIILVSSFFAYFPLTANSEFTFDNTQNDTDIVVKLYQLDSRVFFGRKEIGEIRVAQGTTTYIDKLNAGKYEIYYKELDTGVVQRSEVMELKKESNMILTFNVSDGNTDLYPVYDDQGFEE